MGRNSFRSIEDALAADNRRAMKIKSAKSTKSPALILADHAEKSPQKIPTKIAQAPGQIRIIGGIWRKTVLNVPHFPGLRPTPQRVRETVFNWLGQKMDALRCLDAFAGTGALGFEAASRGAALVRMVEQDAMLARSLERITAQLGAHERVHVQRGCGVRALQQSAAGYWHVIFLDPPFGEKALFLPALSAAAQALSPGGFLYLEAPENWSTKTAELEKLGLHAHRHVQAGAVHAHLFLKESAQT